MRAMSDDDLVLVGEVTEVRAIHEHYQSGSILGIRTNIRVEFSDGRTEVVTLPVPIGNVTPMIGAKVEVRVMFR